MAHPGHEDAPAHLWARQSLRASLAPRYWDLAGGRPGARVADVGCGPGFFTLRYAAWAGPTGHVHAVDADAAMLEHLRAQLDPVHHARVTTEVLDIARAPLPELHFDAVLCTDALHHMSDVAAALRHMRVGRAQLVVAEFDPAGAGDIGPPLEMRLAPDALARSMLAAGWAPDPPRALGEEHYAIVARPT